MTMREKIAKSIYERRNGHGAKPWAHQSQAHRDPYLSDADAVLDALIEPTEGMIEAVEDHHYMGDRECPTCGGGKPAFQAMVRAAKEGK